MDSPYVFVVHSSKCPHKSKKFHRGCKCSKWLYVPRARRRVSAKTRSWAAAEQKAKALAVDNDAPISPDRQTIQAAVAAFLADKETQNLAAVSLRKLRFIFNEQLLSFSNQEAIVYLDQLNLARLERFRARLGNSPLTVKKKLEFVRSFFRYCILHDWMSKNPAAGLSRIKVKAPPTVPFTAEEFIQLLATVRLMYTSARGLNSQTSTFLRARLRAMLLLLRWSGLRIGDAANLKRSRLSNDDKLLLYTAKTGTPVFVPLPPYVANELRALPNSNPDYFFCSGNGTMRSVTANWQRKLDQLFKKADLNRRCHVHQLRDTFAVEMLLAGVPLDQVAMLLGHSSVKITEKHYAPWIRARQAQLEESVRKAWAAVPTELGNAAPVAALTRVQ
jgi:integrase/recombinase XerD